MSQRRQQRNALTREIEGLGTVTIRALSRGRIKRIRAIEDVEAWTREIVRRGLIAAPGVTEPPKDPDALPRLVEAILEHSGVDLEAGRL